MARWKIKGFVIYQWPGDHGAHVHVYRGGEYIGRYDYEQDCWLDGPRRAAAQANAAVSE
ncbi:MAG: hypothetical protein NTW87_25150 [Planctomycetota bacterium]|nr:hypothetical protein [Planctomycetota bacterium]